MSGDRLQVGAWKLLGMLPARAERAAATLLYVLLYRIAGYRKRVVTENLKSVFDSGNAKELTLQRENFYRHIATLLLEISRTPHLSPAQLKRRVRISNPDLVAKVSNDFTQTVLILSLHQGNWEWLLSGVAATLEQPLHVVYKPLHNAPLDDYLRGARERFGCRAIPVAELGSDLVARRRTPRLLVMAADQAPVADERQHSCKFLGRDTEFHAMPGELAARLRLPVLFARCHRATEGHYSVEFQVIADGESDIEAREVTARYAAYAQAAVLEQPETWLWSHRRWRSS